MNAHEALQKLRDGVSRPVSMLEREATAQVIAELVKALTEIAQMDPEEWGKQGIWRAQKIASTALSKAQVQS